MTGTQHLPGPGAGLFGQIGRWLTLAGVTVAAAFMLFFSAAFALVLISAIAILALIAVSVFWIRAKLTGRPFGPRAQMDAHMADIRRQMGVDQRPDVDVASDGPIIEARETPEGWTVER
ncbi:hypothetical protein GCM10007853_15730 [Algimonas ampicilliniresistens]|jgi:shikimate kinase|uniref:Uncharacterized protein n=1 Tax=Algimonas ampicilliniresistens TaxID=1298735 RepID=A0ABQ5VAB6_9PROT|nr:hypothetical protein [Algimonas ampicilliniresistens]GLQ23699.1 hypothetical protein GCM10007853_15730 [Algimonas ampicilliniresistens]